MGQKRWDRKEKRTAMTEPVKEKKEKDSNDGKILTDKKINGQKRTIIDHFTLMRFSMSLTTSLGWLKTSGQNRATRLDQPFSGTYH